MSADAQPRPMPPRPRRHLHCRGRWIIARDGSPTAVLGDWPNRPPLAWKRLKRLLRRAYRRS